MNKCLPLGNKMTPQHIDIKLARRIETGALKIGDDWTGYFIRSEDCNWLCDALSLLIDEYSDEYVKFPTSKAKLLEDFIYELRKV